MFGTTNQYGKFYHKKDSFFNLWISGHAIFWLGDWETLQFLNGGTNG